MRAENRLAWNQAVAVIPRAIGIRGSIFVDDRRRSGLVALNAGDLPSPCYFTCDSVIQIFLPMPHRKFVEIAHYECVRDILVADRLFAFQVVRILRSEHTRIESRLCWESRIGIGECFGKRIRSQQVQSIPKTALQRGLQSVVGGLTEVLQTAIGGDGSILRERPQ